MADHLNSKNLLSNHRRQPFTGSSIGRGGPKEKDDLTAKRFVLKGIG